jgi:hypothetical protein
MSTLVEGIEAIPSASRREAGREDVLAPHDPARVGEAVAEVEPARRVGATSAAARPEVLVGQPEFEAMTGDGAGGDRDMTFAGSGSCLLHRFRHFAGDEGEGCVRVDSDPVGGLSLSQDDDRHIHGESPVLAVGDVELPGDWAAALTTAPSPRTKVTSEMA